MKTELGQVSFRPIQDSDLPFLKKVYASTRAEEMVLTGWPQEQVDEFLALQFRAQHEFYQAQFQDCQFDLILLDSEAAGRLYLDRRDDEIRIVDIALLPEFRNKGLGYQLLCDVLREGVKASLPVRIHVEHNNPVMSLYKRLGFKKTGDNGVYFLMEWQPNTGHNPPETSV